MNVISPSELQTMLHNQEDVFLLDVREPWEFAITHIPNSINIPLGQLREDFIDKNITQKVVTICHHGVRSTQACVFLKKFGITEAYSLRGGVDAYATLIDPTLIKY